MNVVDNINHNLKRSIPLTKPIEFLIQHKPFKRVRKRKCTYWEFKYAKGRVLFSDTLVQEDIILVSAFILLQEGVFPLLNGLGPADSRLTHIRLEFPVQNLMLFFDKTNLKWILFLFAF